MVTHRCIKKHDTKFVGWNPTRDPNDRERNNHLFYSSGLHIDMSHDKYLPQTNTDEGEEEDYHYDSGDNRFLGSSLNQLRRYVKTSNDETSPDALYVVPNRSSQTLSLSPLRRYRSKS
jgi:hypothetical protein